MSNWMLDRFNELGFNIVDSSNFNPQPKSLKIQDKKYKASFRDKRCDICNSNYAVVGHHIANNRLRDDHIIGLCFHCHAEIHNSGKRTFYKKHHINESKWIKKAEEEYKRYKNV